MAVIILNEGIEAGSDYGNTLGFTSDKFEGYLWQREEQSIYISLIMSLRPNEGNFSTLVRGLNSKGLRVKVPVPFPRMKIILEHLGFEQTYEQDEIHGDIEVWVLS